MVMLKDKLRALTFQAGLWHPFLLSCECAPFALDSVIPYDVISLLGEWYSGVSFICLNFHLFQHTMTSAVLDIFRGIPVHMSSL